MYSMITSSVTFPELAAKNPRAHRWRPQQCFPRWLYSCNQLARALPLEPLHPVPRRHVRRAGDEQVDVILADVTFEDLGLQLRTDRPDDLAEPQADVASQQLLAILGDPHQVELDVEAG